MLCIYLYIGMYILYPHRKPAWYGIFRSCSLLYCPVPEDFFFVCVSSKLKIRHGWLTADVIVHMPILSPWYFLPLRAAVWVPPSPHGCLSEQLCPRSLCHRAWHDDPDTRQSDWTFETTIFSSLFNFFSLILKQNERCNLKLFPFMNESWVFTKQTLDLICFHQKGN